MMGPIADLDSNSASTASSVFQKNGNAENAKIAERRRALQPTR
jgi:hypothetical protein